ncbi:MAG TPA: hypothetical protein VF234_06355 [Limnochordia bacterium]
MTTTAVKDRSLVVRYLREALASKDATALQVAFDIAVLDKYRDAGDTFIRTKSAGRLIAKQGWHLDFGIVDEDGVIHTSFADLLHRLPAAEREHWVEYVVVPPLNSRFLKLRLGLGACIDEGDISDWDGRPQR